MISWIIQWHKEHCHVRYIHKCQDEVNITCVTIGITCIVTLHIMSYYADSVTYYAIVWHIASYCATVPYILYDRVHKAQEKTKQHKSNVIFNMKAAPKLPHTTVYDCMQDTWGVQRVYIISDICVKNFSAWKLCCRWILHATTVVVWAAFGQCKRFLVVL